MTIVEERPLVGPDTASRRTAAAGAMSVASWRLAARLARREVRRRPGRTLLVALLVAIPVLAMTIGAIIVRSDTDDAAFTRSYGSADVVVTQWWYVDPEFNLQQPLGRADLEQLTTWPDGATSTEILSVYTSATPADAEPVDINAMHSDADSASMERLIGVRSGRLPSAGDEVLLHPSVADDLGVGVGDHLVLERPDRTVLVTGLGQRVDDHNNPIMLFAELDRADIRNYQLTTLIDLPPGVDGVSFATALLTPDSNGNMDFNVETRSGQLYGNLDDGRTETLAWGWVVGVLALAALSVIIAAAFATSARRQLATVGQLAANGASPRLIRRTLSLQGTWSGVVGALVGIVAGILAFLLGTPIIERIVGRDWTNTTVRPLDMAILLATGTAAATVAALLPSRSLANTSVLGALAGRRPIRPVRATTVTIGAISFVAGIFLLTVAAVTSSNSNDGSNNNLLALVAIIGGVCVLAGMCLAAPLAITASTAVASRLGATWRLAGRSLHRTRWRSAAVVTAIGVAGAVALVAGTSAARLDDNPIEEPTGMPRNQAVMYASQPDGGVGNASSIDPGALRDVRDTLGPATESMVYGIVLDPPTDAEYRRYEDQFNTQNHVVVATGNDVSIADDELLDGMGLSAADRQRLAEVGALAAEWYFPQDDFGRPITSATVPLIGSGRTLDVEIARLEDFTSYNGMRGILLTRAKADDLGLEVIPTGIRFVTDHDLTAADRRALDAVGRITWYSDSWLVGDEEASDFVAEDRGFWIYYQWVNYAPPQTLIQAGIAGATLLLVLIVVAIGLSLAAAESRDERNTLIAVGASPKTLRRRSATTAALLAATGGALAVPTGLLPTAVVLQATDGDFTVPWVSVVAITVVIPIVVGVVALVGSTVTQRLRPPRVVQDRVD